MTDALSALTNLNESFGLNYDADSKKWWCVISPRHEFGLVDGPLCDTAEMAVSEACRMWDEAK